MSASGSRLEGLTKDLKVHWLQTKEYWSDAKSQGFAGTNTWESSSPALIAPCW